MIPISLLCDENGKSIVAPTLSSFNRKIFSRLWPVWGNGKIQHIQRLVLILSKLFDYPNFFHICHVPGLSLTVLNLHREPFQMFLSVRYLLVLTMCIDPAQRRITGVILDPPPFLVFSFLISSSPSHVCAMSCTTFDARLFPDSIKHSINKTLSGGSSSLWIEG